MAEGVVKWFDSELGSGVLVTLAYADGDITVGGQDVSFHYSDIQMSGYKTLDEGERVAFAIERTPEGGVRARRVIPLGGPPEPWPIGPADAPVRPRRSKLPLVVLLFVVVLIIAIIWSG